MSGRIGAAGAALLTSLLVGCSAQDPPPSDPPPLTSGTTTSSAPASVSPTSPASTTEPIGAPVLPAAAKAHTPAGAEAFVRHWFDLLNYAYTTLDTNPYRAISAGTCLTCDALADTVDNVADRGNRIGGGQITIRSTDAAALLANGGASVSTVFGAAELSELSTDGALVDIIEPDGGDVSYLIDLNWTGSQWTAAAARLLG